ncbi:MAG: purine-binding chemotaxis protein CheW [Nitrospinae bacterium]|nr:purine-binding chemotaxis protein CheW [Nitrospinota bacterium]
MKKYITFFVGNELFGIDVLRVQEINLPLEFTITPLPKSPLFLKGILNLRGKLVPIIDLRNRFSLDGIEWDTKTRIIITKFPDRLIGVVVDKVSDVKEVNEEKIEPPPATVSGIDAAYIEGIYKLEERLVTFLNVDKIVVSGE